VIVNDAGSSLVGTVEDMSEDQIGAYMQSKLQGAIRVWKACLPVIRRNRAGTLIIISSV
jgi:NADP-dependent 3-hydroxy acid dehydrogenase YdfG